MCVSVYFFSCPFLFFFPSSSSSSSSCFFDLTFWVLLSLVQEGTHWRVVPIFAGWFDVCRPEDSWVSPLKRFSATIRIGHFPASFSHVQHTLNLISLSVSRVEIDLSRPFSNSVGNYIDKRKKERKSCSSPSDRQRERERERIWVEAGRRALGDRRAFDACVAVATDHGGVGRHCRPSRRHRLRQRPAIESHWAIERRGVSHGPAVVSQRPW